MTLKAVLTEAPSAELSGYYAENDGKWLLQVEPHEGYALEDIGGLKSALSKERASREDLSKQLQNYSKLDGKDLDGLLAAQQELEKLRASGGSDEALAIERKKIAAQFGEQLTEKETALKTAQSEIDKLVRHNEAAQALSAAKGSVDLLMPHVLQHTRTVSKNGAAVVEVLDADGNVRFNSKGAEMSVMDLVEEMRQNDTYSRAFDASGHSGSGKLPTGSTGSTAKGDIGGSRDDRVRALKSRFPDLA